ncbi:uncharacterized protein [Haliotis cracherodii]|uniref:uncharacterized protein n=1 Tax=Haliotis cracherodii TaxID=6455 RepID=UPI0039E85D63
MRELCATLAKNSSRGESDGKSREEPIAFVSQEDGGAHGEEGETSDEDMIDNLVNQCIDSEHSSVDNGDEADLNSLMKDMVEYFGEEDAAGPEITGNLTRSVNEGLSKPPNMVKLKSLLDKYKRPKNVGNLLVPRVNEVIWNEAGPLTRARDIRMQHTQGMITKAIVPITEMMDELMTAVANRQQVNAIKMLDKTKDSLRILIGVETDLNVKRRDNFKPDLQGPCKRLCSADTPTTAYLFGDDLPNGIKDITECKGLSNKLHTPGKSVMHRGSYTPGYGHRNPGKRFRPYDSQRHRKGGFVKNKGFQSGSDRGRTGNHRNQGPFLGRRPSGPKPHHRKF